MSEIVSTPEKFLPRPGNRFFEEHYLSPEKNCRFQYALGNSPTHCHADFYEFSLVTKGSFINDYMGKKRQLTKNTLVFFGLGQTHGIYVEEPESVHFSFIIKEKYFTDFCACHFSNHPEMTSTLYVESKLSFDQAEYLNSIVGRMNNTPGEDHTDQLDLFIYNALFFTFLRHTDKAKTKSDDDDANKYIKDMLHHFDQFDYVNTNVSAIYASYPLSQSTLITQFKRYTGYTIVQYRHIKRMEYAAHMLTVYKCSVTEVAAMIGISSLSYFSKKFKEHFGILPSEYYRRSVNHRWNKNK